MCPQNTKTRQTQLSLPALHLHARTLSLQIAMGTIIVFRSLSYLCYGLALHGMGGFLPAMPCARALAWRAELLLEGLLGAPAEQVCTCAST